MKLDERFSTRNCLSFGDKARRDVLGKWEGLSPFTDSEYKVCLGHYGIERKKENIIR